MGAWDKARGKPLGRTILEVAGDLSIDSPGRQPIRGSGVVAVMPGGTDGVGNLRWLVRKGVFSTPIDGVVLGNFIIGHSLDRDVLVIRYAELGPSIGQEIQMQLAFRGAEAARLARAVSDIEAPWKAVIDAQEADEAATVAEDEHAARPLDEAEMAAIVKHMGGEGSVVLWAEPDPENFASECRFRLDMAMRHSPCVPSAAIYHLAGLQRSHFPEASEDDDDWDEIQEDYLVCARCVRRTLESLAAG